MATETLGTGSECEFVYAPRVSRELYTSVLSARTSEPPKKRTRAEDSTERKGISNRPQLYAPFRALGLVTTHVPFVLQTTSYKGAVDGPKVYVLTCLGNSWALWDGGKMTLLFVGK